MLCTMKSSQARMKSSAFASDEIKSASPNPTKSDFIAKRFHPTQVGFLPPSADLVEKSTHCLGRQMCAFFWWGRTDSNHRSDTQQIYSLSPLATRELPHMRFCLYGAGRRTRTPDLLITNQLLYRLSYTGASNRTCLL